MKNKILSMVLPELYKPKKKLKLGLPRATLVTKLSKVLKQDQSQRKTISKLEESILNFSLTPIATTHGGSRKPADMIPGATSGSGVRKTSDVTHNRCKLPLNLRVTPNGLLRRDSF